MGKLKYLFLPIMIVFAIQSGAQSLEPDLCLPAKQVRNLYEIIEQRKLLLKRIENDRKVVDSLNTIVQEMNVDSKEFVSHQMDLQAGLLGSLKKQEVQEVEIAKLKASKTKWYNSKILWTCIGFFGGGYIVNQIK